MKRTCLILLAALMLLSLISCASSEDRLVGTWASEGSFLGFTTQTKLTFREDGTGKRSTVLDTEFTYRVEEDKLILDTEIVGIASTEQYTFSFEGDKLLLTKDGTTTEFTKVS